MCFHVILVLLSPFRGCVSLQHKKERTRVNLQTTRPHESKEQHIIAATGIGSILLPVLIDWMWTRSGLWCGSVRNSFPGWYRLIWLCFSWTGTPEEETKRQSQEGSAADHPTDGSYATGGRGLLSVRTGFTFSSRTSGEKQTFFFFTQLPFLLMWHL